MKRIKLVVAYDGTNYCGWQVQNNGETIEGVLNRELSKLLGENIIVTGASRTDSGVHSLGNVAVFDTETRIPAEKISYALNQRLPEDIRIQNSSQVADDFHPRKQNCVKTYEYRILNREFELPSCRFDSHFFHGKLDEKKMQEACRYFLGEHDFKSFCSVRTQEEDTVRTIYSLSVSKIEDMITIRVSGSGFLYNMVRIIAGTLIRVGMGSYPPDQVEAMIAGRDRALAGPTAPAKGLTMIGLQYEEQLEPVIEAENREWKYRLIQTEIGQNGKAYLVIERCRNEEFEGLLDRLTLRAGRNGARKVYITDREQNRVCGEPVRESVRELTDMDGGGECDWFVRECGK